ncbi:MAG: BTAD domain-containing putative transcriptional regulator [Dongiaceae bacterium]
MPASVELKLLGAFEGRLAGGPSIDLPGQKDRALLALLALAPVASQPREKLASLLWSDRGEEQARDSLKHSLTRLRHFLRAANPSPIVADRLSVRLDPADLAIDVARFEQLVRTGTPETLAEAAALYRGDLLDGIGVRDPAFEAWLRVERERLRQIAEDALTRLLQQAMAGGEEGQAASAARRLLVLDPLSEVAARALMELHAARDQTAQAAKVYEALRDRLQHELGVKPAAETTRLYEAIRVARAGTARQGLDPAGPMLPSKPSIAVLPFQNLGGDPEQEYFADGIVEEIITELSRFRSLFVIARNSSFAYKDRAADPKEISRALGVRYLLQGSVRKAGGRVRITGQLVEGASGVHLWAERFEGGPEDIFHLQDQVTAAVIAAIAPKLEQAEIERAKRKSTESLDAYECFLRGMAGVHRWSRHENAAALASFYRAMELDPDFASAYGMATRCYLQRKASGWVDDRAKETGETERLARRAAELGKDDAVALTAAGMALSYVVGRHDEGGALIERGLRLNPNLAWAWLFSGWVRVWSGEPDEAIRRLARAMRLSPNDSQIFSMQTAMAAAHFFAGRYAESFSWAQRARGENPDFLLATATAAASGALAGELEEAASALQRLRQGEPALRLSNLREFYPIRKNEDLARWAEGMRRAGLT